MFSRTATAAAVAISAAIAAPIAATPANAAPMLEVNQGWKISTPAGGCTIGFNDVAGHRSYTAAHCGAEGDKVYLTDANGKRYSTPAGVFKPSANWDRPTISNDWAVIEWDSNVVVKPNIYGDRVVSLSELSVGDPICFHGYSTHGSSKNASCGAYAGQVEQAFHFDPAQPSRKGDSGGPVFAPGLGLVGVLSGDTEFVLNGQDHRLERASTLSDGPLLDWDEITDFGFTYFDAKVNYTGPQNFTPSEAPSVQEAPARATVAEQIVEYAAPAPQAPAPQAPAPEAPAAESASGFVPAGKDVTKTVRESAPASQQDMGTIIGAVVAVLAVLGILGAAVPALGGAL